MADMSTYRVLVTPTSYGKGNPLLVEFLEGQVGEVVYNRTGRPLNENELTELIADVDGCIAGLDQFSQAVIHAGKKLKVISRYGVGLDNIDLEAAKKKKIMITNTPGANASSVADLTIAFILLLCRQVCWSNEKVKGGEWPRTTGLGLEDKTVGLIGLGAIGKQVAQRLSGFGCRILVYDVLPMDTWLDKHAASCVNLDTLLAESDFVSLHLPVTPQTENMVNASFLGKMKNGSFIVNTSRGELIDETALVQALQDKSIAGAGLDAFREEPLPKDHPLQQFSQVITTPHMGAHTDSAVNAMGWMSTKDCLAALRGEKPQFVVSF